jgi:hypothetical protein
MKYLKGYSNFNEPVNEEFLGKLFNFFKNMWNKAMDNLKKLGENPKIEDIRKWLSEEPLNKSSNSYMFKSIIDEFKKKDEKKLRDEDCLQLVEKLIDPETGVLGKQGLQPLYDNLLKNFGKETPTIHVIQYIMNTIRNRVIKDYTYAVEADKKTTDLSDGNHLPDLKKALSGKGEDIKKKKEITLKWVEGNLLLRLDKYVSEIKDEDIKKYVDSKGIKEGSGDDFKNDDKVIYLKQDKKKEQYNSDKKPEEQSEVVSTGIIKGKDGEEYIIEFGSEGKTTKKTKEEIMGKVDSGDGNEDLSKKLGSIKTDQEKMKKVSSYVDFINDEKNKEKVSEIEKIIKGE